MTYVDAYAAPVPTANRDAYRKASKAMSDMFREHGALEVVDCWGNDVPDGKLTSFPLAVKLEDGETVAFGWIKWPSKAVRDDGMAKAMADARMPKPGSMPFDGKRMIFGGFEVLFER